MLFTLGLAKKVLLADRLAELVDPLFAERTRQQPLALGDAWNAALAFSFQLFLDFSAYTEMAIGIALMFGLLLPENFRRPYVATDLRDFWRRWHISLSNFIRDYLYIPLGGSRHGAARYVVATLVSMGLCGLWHGAGWTYAAWGVWHGVGLVVCRFWQQLKRPMPAALGWLVTMVFVLAGWVLFRAADFAHRRLDPRLACRRARARRRVSRARVDRRRRRWCRRWFRPRTRSRIGLRWPRPAFAAAAAVLAAYCVLEVGRGPPLSFIYFRF